MRWLWRDYPKPITVADAPPGAGRGIFSQLVPRREVVPPPATPTREGGPGRGGAPQGAPPAAASSAPAAGRGGGPRGAVYALIDRDKPWEQVGDTYKSAASPAMDKDGNVFFADPTSNKIYKSDGARVVTVFKENTVGARALRFGADAFEYQRHADMFAAQRLERIC